MLPLALIGGLLGCGHPAVDVGIRAAVVAPEDWDGMGLIGAVARPGAAAALGSVNPLAGAVGEHIIGGVLDSLAPPDTSGWAVVAADGTLTDHRAWIPVVQDSFTPVWAEGAVQLVGVPLSAGYAIQVSLVDEDAPPFNEDDPIATVVLTEAELRAALRASAREPTPSWVDTEAMTSGKLLKVAIVVTRTPRVKPNAPPAP